MRGITKNVYITHLGRLRAPESEVDSVDGVEAGNRDIVGNGLDLGGGGSKIGKL